MRLLGAHRDAPGCERGAPLHHLVGASSDTVPDSWSLLGPWTRCPDQRGESCQGHAYAQALRTMSRGTLDPSALAIYAIARQLDGGYVSRLADKGSYTHLVVDGLERWGAVDRSRFGDGADLSARVTQDVLEAGADALITGVYRLEETGKARPVAIRRAVHAGHPVCFAMGVDASYMQWRDGVWHGAVGPIEGGHAQCIVGYSPDGALVANSWGEDWGTSVPLDAYAGRLVRGLAWVDWDWLDNGDVYDLQVITAAPTRVV